MVVNRPLDRRASGLKLGGLALDFEGALRLGWPCLWRKGCTRALSRGRSSLRLCACG
jgi:hypothetical protein